MFGQSLNHSIRPNSPIHGSIPPLWVEQALNLKPLQPHLKRRLLSHFKLFPWKRKARWLGPFKVTKILPCGMRKIKSEATRTLIDNRMSLELYVVDDESSTLLVLQRSKGATSSKKDKSLNAATPRLQSCGIGTREILVAATLIS
ncbi:Uncharacterized protein TCM_009063 [Theobroma cacao]|uniref:Uncharacterized protein n=1 Tax=Theobroma cacao TaxID=3641 RepID=A0A061E5P9_THECC|nr:Uncharacterized protein TCM_009063 [Theobroma cacao]